MPQRALPQTTNTTKQKEQKPPKINKSDGNQRKMVSVPQGGPTKNHQNHQNHQKQANLMEIIDKQRPKPPTQQKQPKPTKPSNTTKSDGNQKGNCSGCPTYHKPPKP